MIEDIERNDIERKHQSSPIYGARKSIMFNPFDRDTPEECRARRRRRIEKRRLVSGKGLISPSTPNHSDNRAKTFEENQLVTRVLTMALSVNPNVQPTESIPVYGTMSVAGRSRKMEDAISIQTELCRPEINGRRPVHFFGVFDGHGGSHVSALCRDRMHVLMTEELMSVGGDVGEEGWRSAIKRCFERMDELAMNICVCGITGPGCRCGQIGTTALVTLLTQEYIFLANCGDSRAVLGHAGRAVPLSRDHKPDRVDELARIRGSGGQVYNSDVPRVEGILAMSRAIGDKYLKPSVSSEPEITIMKREEEDDYLILGSDGIWDKLSNELACHIVYQCLTEVHDNVNRAAAATSAASVLARLALARNSHDNISVIVVDLNN